MNRNGDISTPSNTTDGNEAPVTAAKVGMRSTVAAILRGYYNIKGRIIKYTYIH